MIETSLGKSVAQNLSTGGTVDGDLVVTGTLGVGGDVSINLTSVVSNSTIIDATGAEAFLVRANSDGGDVLIVNTSTAGVTVKGTFTVGTDGSGSDVVFYSATAGDSFLWDSSEEKLTITGTNGQVALAVADGNVTISDDLDVDGTTNLDSVDVDGNMQLDGTFTVGTNGSGYDVTFYSSTSGDSLVWDASEEKLTITGTNGQTALDVADGNLVVADSVDIEGDIDVNGTSNFDDVDIDGDVDISGSITNATWTGDVIASAYLDSDTAHLSGTQTFSGSKTFSANTIISSTNQLQFGDTGTYIHQSADGVLDLVSDTEIELTAGLIDIDTTTLDINGTAINFESSSADAPILTIKNTHDGTGSPRLYFNHASANPDDNDEIGQIRWYGLNDAGTPVSDVYAQIKVNQTDVSSGSEDGKMSFNLMQGGSNSDIFILDADSKISLSNNDSGTANTVFGKSSANIDSNSNYNTFVGENVSDASMNGATSNTAIGYSSASGLTSGDNNVMVGSTAGQSATTSSKSVYIGAEAGEGANHNHNTYVGYQSGKVSGNSDNTAVGYLALGSGSNGYSNVAIGREALKNTTGHMAVAVGEGALQENTSGQYNVGVGWSALRTNVDGDKNTAVGYKSLYTFEADTDGHGQNSALGWESGTDLTTGTEATLIGANAGGNLTTGDYNTALGSYSLATSTGANSCTALGRYAMGAGNATADGTTAVGASACAEKIGGGTSTAVGFEAMRADLYGEHNTAVGYQALENNTIGDGNTAVGARALQTMVADNNSGNNTAIGFEALLNTNYVSSSHPTQNIALGCYAGKTNTEGSENCFLGWNAGATNTTGSNNTTLGSQSNVSASGASNQTVLGQGATGVANNSVTLGNANVTAVYMSSDSQAVVHTCGIQFPATVVENADGNCMDDYEEGLVTNLAFAFGGNSAGQTYHSSRNQARYTKIGNRVFVGGWLELSDKGSSTGAVTITGLPFTVQDHLGANTGGAIGYMNNISFADFPMLTAPTNTTTLQLYETTNSGATTTLTEANLDTSGSETVNFMFGFHYNTQ